MRKINGDTTGIWELGLLDVLDDCTKDGFEVLNSCSKDRTSVDLLISVENGWVDRQWVDFSEGLVENCINVLLDIDFEIGASDFDLMKVIKVGFIIKHGMNLDWFIDRPDVVGKGLGFIDGMLKDASVGNVVFWIDGCIVGTGDGFNE